MEKRKKYKRYIKEIKEIRYLGHMLQKNEGEIYKRKDMKDNNSDERT